MRPILRVERVSTRVAQLAAWLCLGVCVTGFSQDTSPDDAVAPTIPVDPESSEPADAAEAEFGPQEIVVTATKRSVSVRDIPGTVTAISGADLERQGVQNIDQIVALVPGVNLTDDGQGQSKRITIRGISADTNVNFTTGTLFGDIPFSDPFIPKVQLDPNPFDMASVEVLKGPQGTLFGGSGLNGMIRYVPEVPRLDEFEVKYFGQYESFPGNGDIGTSFGAVVNVPLLAETLALRVMGFHRDSPGYVDSIGTDDDDANSIGQDGYRAMLGWEPSEAWKINLMLVGQQSHQDDVAFTNNNSGRLERTVTPRTSPVDTDYRLANLGIVYELEWADVVSQTSFVDKEYEAFLDTSRLLLQGAVPLLAAAGYNESQAFVQEVRLVSASTPEDDWKWLVGAFYYDLDLFDCVDLPTVVDGLPINPLPGLIAVPCSQNADRASSSLNLAHLEGDLKIAEKALFGEVTRRLSERFELTLGARFYRTTSEGDVTSAGALYATQTGGSVSRRSGDVEEQGVSPKVILGFRPTEDVLTYASISKGFRFGGIQLGASTPTTAVPATFKSDTLWNYELGIRSEWMDKSLFVDASAYFIDWTDPQVYQQSVDTLVTFIDNVGGVEGHGVELALLYLPPVLNGFSVSVAASWNRTTTTEDFTSSNGAFVAEGSSWPLSPEWQVSSQLRYQLPLQEWDAAIAARHTYSGKACNTIECTANVFGYRTIDLLLSLGSVTARWLPEINLSFNNLADERGISNVTTDGPGGLETVNYIPPRSVILRLSGRF